jgi:hypothetical protein
MIRRAEVPKRTFEDALYILSIEKDMPDAALLDEVIRTSPEFSEELTDFAIELAIDRCTNRIREEGATPTVAELQNVSPAVSRALSRFQNCLHSVQTTAVSDSILPTVLGVSLEGIKQGVSRSGRNPNGRDRDGSTTVEIPFATKAKRLL